MSLSRKFEKQADEFATNARPDPTPFILSLKKLAVDNLSNLNPHPLYVLVQLFASIYSGADQLFGTQNKRIWRKVMPESSNVIMIFEYALNQERTGINFLDSHWNEWASALLLVPSDV